MTRPHDASRLRHGGELRAIRTNIGDLVGDDQNPKDDVANILRQKFKDRLLGLIDTRANLLGVGQNEVADGIGNFSN